MEINLAPATVMAAKTPEEAAVVFKEAATAAMAQVLTEAIAKAMGTRPFADNPALAGWESFVQGLHVEMAWAKPALKSTRALTQVTAYSPLKAISGGVGQSLLGFEVGISVKGTF